MSFCVTGAVVEALELLGSWMASQPWFARPLYHLACSDWGHGLVLFVVVQLCVVGWSYSCVHPAHAQWIDDCMGSCSIHNGAIQFTMDMQHWQQ
jgi:hypothetical protein